MSIGSGPEPGGVTPPGQPGITQLLSLLDLAVVAGASAGEGGRHHAGWFKTDLSLSVDGGVSASRQVLSGDVCVLGGWVLSEPTGTAGAAVRLHDGSGTGGEQFGRINLATSATSAVLLLPHGVICSTGRVFCEVISGQVEGVLLWR